MNSPGITDSHIHLTDYNPDTDLPLLIKQADEVGVSRLVCNGTWEGDWAKVLELGQLHQQVIPCVGLHPWFIQRCTDNWKEVLESYVKESQCGVGETGLDRCAKPFDRDKQEDAFRFQLYLARKYERPIMVHCVDAFGWMFDIIRSENDLPRGMMLHSYGGSSEMARQLADRGAYFSFCGKILFENYKKQRESIKSIPLDKLLIETDAPCMLPPDDYRPYAVKTDQNEEHNHPANLPAILKGIAQLLDIPPEKLKEILWENARRYLEPIWK